MVEFDDPGEDVDEPEPEDHRGYVNVPFVIGCAVLIGVGLFMIFYWLFDFSQWFWFLGVPIVLVGFLLFLSPHAGLDHAEPA
jgi:uncharacterized protein (DUF983 family)